MDKLIFLMLSLILFVSLVLIKVDGSNGDYEIAAVSGSTPTIDGFLSDGEWSDAGLASFNNTEVFAKQDGVNLYVGFNVSDALIHEEDFVALYLDVLHDKSQTLQLDDLVLGIYRNRTLFESEVTSGSWMLSDISGWTAKSQLDLIQWQAEFNITYTKIEVTAGVDKTIGVVFLSNCRWLQSYPFTWPHGPIDDINANPSIWGDITSTGYNWVPEFSLVLLLSFIILGTQMILVLCKRKFQLKVCMLQSTSYALSLSNIQIENCFNVSLCVRAAFSFLVPLRA